MHSVVGLEQIVDVGGSEADCCSRHGEAVPDLGEELIGGDANDGRHQHHLEGAHRQTLREDE